MGIFQEVLHNCLSNHLIETLDSFHEFFHFILGLFRAEVPNKTAAIKMVFIIGSFSL